MTSFEIAALATGLIFGFIAGGMMSGYTVHEEMRCRVLREFGAEGEKKIFKDDAQ